MPNPKPISLKTKIPLLLLGFFLIFSCDQQKKVSQSIGSDSSKDSVDLWISQAYDLDSSLEQQSLLLKNAYAKTTTIDNDTLKSNYLTKLSYNSLRSPDKATFRKINAEAAELALKLKDSNSLAEIYWDLGDFYKNNFIPDSAYFHYAKSEKIFTAIDNQKSSGELLTYMAGVQSSIGDYTGAEITAIKALEKLKPIEAYRQLFFCYNELADLSKLLNEFDRALEYYEESLINLRKAKLSILREQSHKNNVGLVYQKKGAHQKAIPYFSEVLNFDSLRHENPRLYGRALNNLGTSYLKINNTDQLPGLFTKAIAVQDSTNDVGGKTSSTHRLAEYYLLEKDTIEAAKQLQLARSYAIQNNDNKRLLEIIRLFSRVDPKNATSYTQEYITLNDSLLNQERHIRDKFARIRFETDEFIAENVMLGRQKQLWTGIAAALLLLGLSTFIIVSQRNKNKILKFRQQQQASNEEIFNLLLAQEEKVTEGKKLEQKRISEELHDGVLGRMLGARMMLTGLNKKTDPVAVSERMRAITILQDVESEVRSISHELSHAAYQKIHNFILSIQDLLKTVEASSKINIVFTFSDDLEWDALNGDIKINLYRMIQENIQNAVKHSECKNIDLNFETDSELLRVTIADNGKGYVVKKGKKGIGMRNIASRMQKVNGTWDIDSTVGQGTTVTLVIPIVANDGSANIKITQEDLQEF